MWANKLRVALALLLVAELGHVRSSPILKKGGSALARSERDVSAGNSNEEYDYERSYIDDPNYYPDPNEEHSDEDDAGDLARSKRDVFKGNTDEEEYDYERSLKEDPNYYPDYDEYYEDKSYEDDAKDNVDDPNYYPDHDDDHSDDKSHEDDDESYVDDPNYYPDYDEEDKSHEDDAKDHVDDPDYHPDHDDDHSEDKSHEDDDEDDYVNDPNYYPDYDDEHSEDKSHEDDDKDYTDDPDYHPDHDDDHSEDKSHEDDDDSYVDDPNYYPDYDEEDKSHEDHAKSVQRRQVKTGNIQQQTGYVKYDVDGAGYDPWRREINQLDGDISFGVEPLRPVQASDVAQGVEAVDGESDDDSYRGWFYNVGDAIEDSFGLVRDKVSGAVDSIHDFAGVAADKIHDAAHSTGTTIVDAYHSLKDRISDLRHRIHHLFSSFGLMVQRGADYCIQHLQHTANQVREAEILDKLQQKLKDGNEQVTAFFTILGEKITSWAKSHGHDNVDQGLILVESHGGHHTDDEGSGNRENVFPNLFQDQDVLDQMNQMVNKGVITQEELDLLYQQTEQVSGPQYNEGTIIESHSRRRHLRSRITVV